MVDCLAKFKQSTLGDIAAKSLKEALYYLERSADTVIALGDGTAESHNRMTVTLEYLWPFIGEMFVDDDIDVKMHKQAIAPLPSSMRAAWNVTIAQTFNAACLTLPEGTFAHSGGRTGVRHTEHLGHMLAPMQTLQRSYPGAAW